MTSASPPQVSLPGRRVRARLIDAKIAGKTRRTDRNRIEGTLSGIPKNAFIQMRMVAGPNRDQLGLERCHALEIPDLRVPRMAEH